MKLNYLSTAGFVRIALGLGGLVLGIWIYLTDRPSELIYFLPDSHSFITEHMTVFGSVGQHLPTFLHPFSFVLITAGLLGCRSARCNVTITLGWLLIDLAFEIAQSDMVSIRLIENIPGWFSQFIVLENTASYLRFGTYDPVDMLSIVLGSLSAFLINRYLNHGYPNHRGNEYEHLAHS